MACLLVAWASTYALAAEPASFVVVERAGPVAPSSVLALDEREFLESLSSELRELPPSTRGFPRWLIHVFAGTERERSYAVFEEDLARFPAIARAIRAEGTSGQRFQYHVELRGSFWERSDEVVEKVGQLGLPAFYLGERSNWPSVEVVLTERLEEAQPPVSAPASEEDAAARAEFFERVGPLLRNKTNNRELDAAYERLADQLFAHHRYLVSSPEVKQFTTRFRRYRWRGNGGARVAVRAEYRTPDRDSAGVIGGYFNLRASETKGRIDPASFGIEIITPERDAEAIRSRLAGLFPDVGIEVRPGRPLVE